MIDPQVDAGILAAAGPSGSPEMSHQVVRSHAAAPIDPEQRDRSALRTLGVIVGLALLIATLAFGGTALRGALLGQYSELPAGFDGPLVFRQRYFVEQGGLLLDPIQTYSYWSGGVNTQLGFYLMEAINASVLYGSSLVGVRATVTHQILLTSLLASLALLLYLHRTRQPVRIADAVAVAGFATLGSPLVINFLTGWNVAYGWLLVLSVTIVAISSLPRNARLFLTLFITAIGPPLYHTFGFLLAVYVALLWLAFKFARLDGVVASPLVVFVCYFTYQAYVSVQFFGELARGLADVVTLQFLSRGPTFLQIPSPQVGAVDLRVLHFALYGLLAVPIGIASFRFLRHVIAVRRGPRMDNESERDEAMLLAAITALALAIGAFGLLLAIKEGIEFAINRMAEYEAIAALMAVIALLRYIPRARRATHAVMAAAIGVSIFSFSLQASTSYAANYLSNAEAEGYTWLHQRLADRCVVLTDFRLSGPFVADGHFRVIGLSGRRGERTEELLDAIYYDPSPATVSGAIDQIQTDGENEPASYLFLSNQMTETYPAISTYGSVLRPASHVLFGALEQSGRWVLIYSNDHARIYQRARQPDGAQTEPQLPDGCVAREDGSQSTLISAGKTRLLEPYVARHGLAAITQVRKRLVPPSALPCCVDLVR